MTRAKYQRTAAGRYRRQLVDPSGRRISVTRRTLAELEVETERLRRLRDDVHYGRIDPRTALRAARSKPDQVADVWARWVTGVSMRSRPHADSAWRRRLAPHFADLPVWELTEDRMRTWAADLARAGFAPKTIRAAFDSLAGAMRLALETGDIARIPWGNWRPPRAEPRRPREACATLADLERLLRAAHAIDQPAIEAGRYADTFFVVVVFALTGLRLRELAALAWDFVEIDTAPEILRIEFQARRGWKGRNPVRPSDPPKGGRRRTQRLHPDAARALRAQREQLTRHGWYRPEGPVFPGRGSEFSLDGVILRPAKLRAIARAAGLPNPGDWTTHSLRHTFCTLETQGLDGDLRTAMRRSGHASVHSLEQYLHPATRGQPAPGIPELAPSVPIALIEAPSPSPGPALPELSLPSPKVPARPLETAARDWIELGKPEKLPLVAREQFRRAYQRAYIRATRAGKPPKDAVRSAKAAERASRGAWENLVARTERSEK